MANDPYAQAWNESLQGDYFWTNVNIGEAVSDVMTPLAWSILKGGFAQQSLLPGHNMLGLIGGRPYFNASVVISALRLMGLNEKIFTNEMGGELDQYSHWLKDVKLSLPSLAFFPIIGNMIKTQWNQSRALRGAGTFVDGNPAWCERMIAGIHETATGEALYRLWSGKILVHALRSMWTVRASAFRYTAIVGRLRRELFELVGEDSEALLSNVSREDDLLASLGPAVGIWKVSRGQMNPEEFLSRYGHRLPNESSVLSAEPIDIPQLFAQQLEAYQHASVDVGNLLERRRAEYDASWRRFQARFPSRAKRIEKRIATAAHAERLREAVRSEVVRFSFVTRACALQAGKFIGVGEDVFYLTIDEVWDLLQGTPSDALLFIPARKETYRRYKSLPVYPAVIRGRFDPFAWAADPYRRIDFYDGHGTTRMGEDTRYEELINGAAGSAGIAEGVVRLLNNVGEGSRLKPGEVLVAQQTNISWTPFFPRAAAVVTDIGAPLSHAAIVARELGIPAVVGCGDATTRLKTGDRVRVNGGEGTVTILS